MTPPTPEQVAALEQWAREAKKWEMVRTDEWPDTILALCETVRAQQAEVTKWQTCSGCGEKMDAPGHCTSAAAEWNAGHMAMLEQAHNERDAAVARAEQAERERDEARQHHADAVNDYEETQATLLMVQRERDSYRSERDGAVEAAEGRDRRILEAEATIAALREQLQAAQAVPPLPERWGKQELSDSVMFFCGYQTVTADEYSVRLHSGASVNTSGLITVLRHAQAAHERLREQAHPTPAQEEHPDHCLCDHCVCGGCGHRIHEGRCQR